MSSLATAFPSPKSPVRAYVNNVAVAARAFAAALFAVQPQAPAAAPDSQAGIAALHSMADQYQSLMPNLATELRFIAARA